MTLIVSTPITGVPQTGMAAPSFAVTQDNAVSVNSRRYVVTAASDVSSASVHSVSSPFYVELTRPASFKPAPSIVPATGLALKSTGKNEYRIKVVKGTVPAPGLNDVILIDASIRIPAGSDVNDAAAVRAAFSLFGGFVNEDGDGIGDVMINGVL